MAIVVDSDVVSYIVKGDIRGALYQPHLANQIATISFMTLAELERWTLIANWGARRQQQLKTHLRRYVLQYSNVELCRLWADTMDNARRAGKPIGVADGWVAATALHLQLPLVTHNRDHFTNVAGLTVISES
ncbi:MAG: PIN domain-containing protein [Acidobacteriota bacterium]|nr:PIN domain-containing protein [Acidobacteriota bacterium]